MTAWSSGAAACRYYPEMLARVGIRADLRLRPSGELDQIMQSEGVTPALAGERSAEEALAEADTIAQEEIDFA